MDRIRPIIRQVLGTHEPFVDSVPKLSGVILVQSTNRAPLQSISRIVGEIGSDDFLFYFCTTSDGTNQHFPEMWREISDLDSTFICGSLCLDHVRVHASIAAFADVAHHAVNTNFVYVRRRHDLRL